MLPVLSIAAFLALLALIGRARGRPPLTLAAALQGLPPIQPDLTPLKSAALPNARLAARLIRAQVQAYNDQHPDQPVPVDDLVAIGLAIIEHEGGGTFLLDPPTTRRTATGEPLFAGWWQISSQLYPAYGLANLAERLDPRKSTRGAVKQLIASYQWVRARVPRATPLSTLGGLVYMGHAQGPGDMRRMLTCILQLVAPLGAGGFPDLQLFIGLLRARGLWKHKGNKAPGFIDMANRLAYYHDHLATLLPEQNVA
jgi:hypothetical protein